MIVRNSIAALLVVISLTQPIGFFTQNWSLFWLGKASAMSPLAIPFREYADNYENFTVHAAVTIWKAGRAQTVVQSDVFDTLTGPHRRKVVYFVGMGRAPIQSETVYEPLFKSFLCQQEQYDRIEVIYSDKRTGAHYKTLEYVCS